MTDSTPQDADRKIDNQASGFEAVRTAHQSEMVEDYVELIAELIHERGAARPVEIAERLGVTQPTVSKNLSRLKREGLIEHEPYRSLRLTEAGRQLAEACRKRHRIVVDFLVALGVSRDVAEHDAEGIEHHVSEETLGVFRAFTERESGSL
ncbi:manganese-binding transcriptional regulator MntR [Ruegeria sp. Alg231-54]|uniref:manganese-binding transcriptional regulator MntR n=1 Tax=Ruegeria sp. Alg231-54 TaxID=1922221 RepID=UPI000D555D3B|nr:manganese-binding transcriptional regulator MntR [Ruegeria sp. Alg231-54]